MHLLLYTAHGSLCGHRWKESSLRAGLLLFFWLPLPAVSHQKAVTAQRQPVLAAAVSAEDAGCRDAYDGASSPGNRNCCLPGTHRAQGRRMPADSDRNRKVAGACCPRHRRSRSSTYERCRLWKPFSASRGRCTYSGLGSSKAAARSAEQQQKSPYPGGGHGFRTHRKRKYTCL